MGVRQERPDHKVRKEAKLWLCKANYQSLPGWPRKIPCTLFGQHNHKFKPMSKATWSEPPEFKLYKIISEHKRNSFNLGSLTNFIVHLFRRGVLTDALESWAIKLAPLPQAAKQWMMPSQIGASLMVIKGHQYPKDMVLDELPLTVAELEQGMPATGSGLIPDGPSDDLFARCGNEKCCQN